MPETFETHSSVFLLQFFSLNSELLLLSAIELFVSREREDGIFTGSLDESLNILLWLLSFKAAIPLYTDIKNQNSNQTDTVFQTAKVKADALRDTKLIIKPVTTGAKSLQIKSIRLITEFIFVSMSGG